MLPPPSGVVEKVAGVHSGVSVVRWGLHALERRHRDAESLRVRVKDYRPHVMQNLIGREGVGLRGLGADQEKMHRVSFFPGLTKVLAETLHHKETCEASIGR